VVSIKSKIVKNLRDTIKSYLLKDLQSNCIPEIKKIILEDYNALLVGRVTDIKSRTAPDEYLEDFTNRLNTFEYIKMVDGEVKLEVPDIDTFDFSGRLRVIQDILEGTVGNYIEVDMKQLEMLYKKAPVTLDYVDASLPPKERIIKLRKTSDVIRRMKSNNLEIVDYPFSNTPPIDIFSRASEQVKRKLLNFSIEKSIKEAQKELANTFSI
jgi:hypothetical protein